MKAKKPVKELFDKILKLEDGSEDSIAITFDEAVIASKGNVSPLLFFWLKKRKLIDNLDEKIKRGLYRDFVTAQADFLFSQNELAHLTEIVDSLKTKIIVFKGGYTRRFYPDPSLRIMGDYDLLVKKEDEREFVNSLIEMGFELYKNPSRKFLDRLGGGFTFKRGDFRKFIDIHSWPFQRFRYPVNLREIWGRCKCISEFFCYPTVEDQIVLTVINLIKDGFIFPLSPWFDLYYLFKRKPDLDYIDYQIKRAGVYRGYATVVKLMQELFHQEIQTTIRAKPLEIEVFKEEKRIGLERYFYALSTINRPSLKLIFSILYIFLAGVDFLYGE